MVRARTGMRYCSTNKTSCLVVTPIMMAAPVALTRSTYFQCPALINVRKGVQRFKLGKGSKLSSYASWWIKQAIRRALSNQSKTIRLPVHDLGLKARRIRFYRDAARTPVSLDSPIGVDDSTSVAEHVVDANAIDPLEELARNSDNELVRNVLASLNSRESQILAMRFGLDDGRPKRLAEVGARMGVTRERIRQIQEEALHKMRVKIESRINPFKPSRVK